MTFEWLSMAKIDRNCNIFDDDEGIIVMCSLPFVMTASREFWNIEGDEWIQVGALCYGKEILLRTLKISYSFE